MWHSYATVPRQSDGPKKKLCGSSTKGASRSLNKLDDRSEVRPWHRYARFKPETERLVGRRMALVEAARGKVSCSLNQPDDMGFPACHIGQKKFYWASVLSIPKHKHSSHLQQADLVRYGLSRLGPLSGPLKCNFSCRHSLPRPRRIFYFVFAIKSAAVDHSCL